MIHRVIQFGMCAAIPVFVVVGHPLKPDNGLFRQCNDITAVRQLALPIGSNLYGRTNVLAAFNHEAVGQSYKNDLI